MKTLLIFPPTPNPAPSYFGPPYALALLGAILKRAGKPVAAVDYDRSSVAAMEADLARVLAEERPDLVGISCLSANRGSAVMAVRRIKELAPHVIVIVGGPFPTLYPEVVFRRCPADLVCVGDGDETLLEVVQTLERGGDLGAVAGLAMPGPDGAVIRTAPRPMFTDLDSLPYPDLGLFDIGALLASHTQSALRADLAAVTIGERSHIVSDAMVLVMTSRGCAWSCSFCPLSKWEGKTLLHSPAYVVDMIEHYLREFGHRTFVFGDNTLSYPKRRLIEMCELIVARGLDIEWICMTRADMVDADVLAAMAAAGCKEISYGIESLAQDVQKAMGKKLSVTRGPPAFELTHAAGISSTMMMMVGNEGETRETMRQTVGAAWAVEPDRILIWTTKVYPGTRLWDRAVREGVIPPGHLDDDLSQPPDYTGENDAAELRHLEGMLRGRTTYVETPAPTATDGRALIERGLLLGVWRSSAVVLGGAHDPLGRDDMPALLAWAKSRTMRSVFLRTDAHALAARAGRLSLQEVADNVLTGLIVPLYAAVERDHDARVGAAGALRQTRKGILAWTRDTKVAVQAWCYLDSRNTGALGAWVEWLHAHGVKAVTFIFGADAAGFASIPEAELPSLREAGAAVREAAAVAKRLGLAVDTVGLPECALGRGAETISVHELGRPFDDRVVGDGDPVGLPAERRAQKRFAAACAGCRVQAGCEGVWTRYLDARGDRELVPCDVSAPGQGRPRRFTVLAAAGQ